LNLLADDEKIKEITTRAYREVVGSGRWSYGNFIRELERDVVDLAVSHPDRRDRIGQRLICSVLRWWDRLSWQLIRFEVWFLSQPAGRRLAIMLRGVWNRLS